MLATDYYSVRQKDHAIVHQLFHELESQWDDVFQCPCCKALYCEDGVEWVDDDIGICHPCDAAVKQVYRVEDLS